MRRRPNGAGSTYWTTNRHGTLICVHQRRKTIDGRERSFKGEGNTEEIAIERCLRNMAKAQVEVTKPQRIVKGKRKPTLASTTSFEQYVRLWSATKHGANPERVGQSQVNRTLAVFENHIFRFINSKPISKITHADINKMLQTHTDDGANDPLLRNIYEALSIPFNYAVRSGHIRANPMNRVELPKARTGLLHGLVTSEV